MIRGGRDIDNMDFQFAARIYPKPKKTSDIVALVNVSPESLDTSNDLLREFFKTTQALIGVEDCLQWNRTRKALLLLESLDS